MMYPRSHLSRFLFSDKYLSRVHPQLALNIYTAVANPITLNGRIALVQGALRSKSPRTVPSLGLPIFALQTTENVFVSPSNVEALLEGRMVQHIWSHETESTKEQQSHLGNHGRALLRATFLRSGPEKSDAACVLWVRAGHEVRQEASEVMLDFFSDLCGIDCTIPIVPHPSTESTSHLRTDLQEGLMRSPRSILRATTDLASVDDSWGKKCKEEVDSVTVDDVMPQDPHQDVHWLSPVNHKAVVDLAIGLKATMVNTNTAAGTSAPNHPVHPQDPVCTSLDDVKAENSKLLVEFFGAHSSTAGSNIRFGMVSSTLALHDLTSRRLASLSSNVATCLSNATGMQIPAENIILRAVFSGSLLLKVEASGIISESMEAAINDALIQLSYVPWIWGGHTSFTWIPRNRNSLADMHEASHLHDSAGAAPEEVASTSLQRNIGRYSDHVDNADEAIAQRQALDASPSLYESNETIAEQAGQRLLKEMQRHVDVDAAEDLLVKCKTINGYDPPPGIQTPVLHPAPSEYKEHETPVSILSRHDPEKMLSIALQAQNPRLIATGSMGVDDQIKVELASAQLLRESELGISG